MIESKISGLIFRENKIISDERGFLSPLVPGGTNHELVPHIGNIYTSVATGRFIPRASHYHHKQVENQFTLSGTCLWVFKDMREGSDGITQAVITGASVPEDSHGIAVCTIDQGKMLHVHIQPEIYHIIYPLTSDPVIVVCASSRPYEAEDYIRLEDHEVKGIRQYIERFL